MVPIKFQIVKLFQNEKIGDIFANCFGGLDMINVEIQKSLTFFDMKEIIQNTNPNQIKEFIDLNELVYPMACEFILGFINKIDKLLKIYENSKSNEYISHVFNDNRDKILKMYQGPTEIDSLKIFVKNYREAHTKIFHKTYYQSQEFFKHPVDYLAT